MSRFADRGAGNRRWRCSSGHARIDRLEDDGRSRRRATQSSFSTSTRRTGKEKELETGAAGAHRDGRAPYRKRLTGAPGRDQRHARGQRRIKQLGGEAEAVSLPRCRTRVSQGGGRRGRARVRERVAAAKGPLARDPRHAASRRRCSRTPRREYSEEHEEIATYQRDRNARHLRSATRHTRSSLARSAARRSAMASFLARLIPRADESASCKEEVPAAERRAGEQAAKRATAETRGAAKRAAAKRASATKARAPRNGRRRKKHGPRAPNRTAPSRNARKPPRRRARNAASTAKASCSRSAAKAGGAKAPRAAKATAKSSRAKAAGRRGAKR